jgi:hypothetical protein
MARSYSFAIVKLVPDDVRDERLNIALLVVREGGVDIREAASLDKIKAVSLAMQPDALRELLQNLQRWDRIAREQGASTDEERLHALSGIAPLVLSRPGTFIAGDPSSYEDRVASILRAFVDPEPPVKRTRAKRTRLYTQVKKHLRRERILARRDEGLDSHRVVPSFQIDEGLVADLVLRNGTCQVVETVDATNTDTPVRKIVADIAVSALTLERARMMFGEEGTRSKLVFAASAAVEKVAWPSLDAAHHQGAEIINWSSDAERQRFLASLIEAAEPIEGKRGRRFVQPPEGGLFH